MRTRVGVLLVALALALSGTLLAHEGHEHVVGTIKAVDANRMEVRTRGGATVTLQLNDQTRYLRGKASAEASDAQVGKRVVVDVAKVGDVLVAREVRLGVLRKADLREAPPAPHSGHGPSAPRPSPPADQAPTPGHEAHPPVATPSRTDPAGKSASHAGHTEAPAGTEQHAHSEQKAMHAVAEGSQPTLYQSDMTLMTGMTPRDVMGGMAMADWRWMAEGSARLIYNRQGGPSGDEAFESSNWNMVMGQRDLGKGRFTLMAMNSLEPATLQEGGSPQLFQTGETFEGRPLVDRQHPHDLFMNLSATYRLPVGSESALWFQYAPVGEPVIGPTAFMHRASSGENPSSPLGHHWQDSTHITNNVFTVGGGWRWLSLESSFFHGQEPDEGRWDIDGGAPDSVAGRLKLDLSRGWSGQLSYAYIKEPEALEEGDTRRTTASLHYGARGDRPLALTLLWGRNDEEHGLSDSFLLEGAYQFTRADHVYVRAESVEKDRTLLATKDLGHADEGGEEATARIQALTVGYLRDVELVQGLKTGVGADLTVYGFPSSLERAYGDSPVSVRAFLRLRWGKPHGAAHAHGG